MFENILTFNYKLIKKIKRKGIKQERERKYIVQKTKKKKRTVFLASQFTHILSLVLRFYVLIFFSCFSAEVLRDKKKKQ